MNKSNYTPIFNDINKIDFSAPWLNHIPTEIRNKSLYLLAENSHQNLADILNQLLIKLYPQGLATGKGKALKFVPQAVLDKINETIPTAYETLIADTGQIPTRDNLHDLFNGWIWLTFPKTKALLNRYQAEQIAELGITGKRGKVRDAITVLDENGAILITSNSSISQALQHFDWQNCLVKSRTLWHNFTDFDNNNPPQAMLMLCGHALIEQLVTPRKPLCSHTFILHIKEDFFQLSISEQRKQVDELLMEKVDNWLQQADVSPRQLSPLPVLGVPYFWAENANSDFYQDNYVFRSGRRKKIRKSKE
ncbi:MAG: DUF3025 domain-containing protein [Moraxellaceae bacterium]|nr:DUF3025 domain-containing protein [Moraxellaceae bacterium]